MAKRKLASELSNYPQGSSGLSNRERREREDSAFCLCGKRKGPDFLLCWPCSLFSRWLMESWLGEDPEDSNDESL